MENKTDYVTISLSMHLVFARIMKEHAFFLENSCMPKDKLFADEAAYHKKKFEKLLSDTIALSNDMLPQYLLESGCVLTKYTMQAEKRTEFLTGINTLQSSKHNTRYHLSGKTMQSICHSDFKWNHSV